MPLHYGIIAGLSPEASIKSGLAAGLGLALVQPRVPQHPSTLEEVVDTETWGDDSDNSDDVMMPVLLTKVCGPDPEGLEVSELLHAGAGRGAGALVGHLQGQLAALEAATCRPADYSCCSCYLSACWYCHLVSE